MNIWMSPTKQKQVHDTGLHYDDDDGLLMVFSGSKKVVLFSPRESPLLDPIELDRNTISKFINCTCEKNTRSNIPMCRPNNCPDTNFVQVQMSQNLSTVLGNAFTAHYRVSEHKPRYTEKLPSAALLFWSLDSVDVPRSVYKYITAMQRGGNISATWSFKQIPKSDGTNHYNWELYYWGWRAPTWSEVLDHNTLVTIGNSEDSFSNTNEKMTLEGVRELNEDLVQKGILKKREEQH